MKMIKNYHSHTTFCKHAKETVEEVTLKALEYGFTELGFSEHIPLEYDDGTNRIASFTELEEYIKEVLRVKKKYENQINIMVGLECDIINRHCPNKSIKSWHEKLEKYKEIDYVIIGHHYLPRNNNKDEWKIYIEKLEDFILYSKKFKYLAHPDIFMNNFKNPNDPLCKWISKEIISLSKKYNFPLGININGLYEDKSYPSSYFFKLVALNNAKTIFEMDNHSSKIWSKNTFDKAYKFAKNNHLHPLNCIKNEKSL